MEASERMTRRRGSGGKVLPRWWIDPRHSSVALQAGRTPLAIIMETRYRYEGRYDF